MKNQGIFPAVIRRMRPYTKGKEDMNMTPQDIRERTFEKAVFGGYDMAGVDDFMEDAAQALESAQRENSTLKAKLKVLVDKIEEYRASEDAMRMTLLSAQKLSNQIESEARERAEKIVADAQAQYDEILGSLKSDREREQQRLDAARGALERFYSDAREVCAYTLDSLKKLEAGELPEKADKAAEVEETVRSISESVDRIPDEPAPEIDLSSVMSEAAPRETITPDDVTKLFDMGEDK